MTSKKNTKSAALIGVVIILLTIIVASLITPGYSHLNQTVSELNSKTAPYRLFMNSGLTVGFLALCLTPIHILRNNPRLRLSGILLLISLLIVLTMTWLMPMDSSSGIRTAADSIHNNAITTAVIVFILAQLTFVLEMKNSKNGFLITIIALGIIFGLLSLYSNIMRSELINISERGWMTTFLVYLIWLPNFLNSENQIDG